MGQSRANLVKVAVRPAMPGRFMLSGTAGSGKTWTALIIARVLVGPDGRIIVIDTETESALTYADEHKFEHLPWGPPFDPRDLAATITELGGDTSTAIIVDSASHFWTGEGGTLDIADGKFGGWKVGTPAQDEMISAMLRSKSHVIVCAREKQAYAVTETVKDGRTKQTVEKLGLAPIQRDGVDYEFNVAATIDTDHTISIHKTRCRVLADRTYRPNHADELAEVYGNWLAGGHPIITAEQAQSIKDRVKALPGDTDGSDIRRRCAGTFKVSFGAPDQLLADDLAEAEAMIESFEAEAWPDGKPVETKAEAKARKAEKLAGPLADAVDATETDDEAEQPALEEATT